MTYVKQTWANGVAGGTPISAARLAHMEDGIEQSNISYVFYVEKYRDTGMSDKQATQAAYDALIAATFGGKLVWDAKSYDLEDWNITPAYSLDKKIILEGQFGTVLNWTVERGTPSPRPSLTTTGGSLGAGNYSYRLALVTASGDIMAGNRAQWAISTGTTNQITLTWSLPTSIRGLTVTGVKIYGRTNGSELLMATLGLVTTWTDNGSITPSGALPAGNSLHAYVIDPTGGGSPVTVRNLTAIGPSTTFAYGSAPAHMSFANLASRAVMENVIIRRFYSGGNFSGDHSAVRQSQVTQCYYGLSCKNQTTSGDNVIDNCDLSGNAMASFGIGTESSYSGQSRGGHLGISPYSVFIEPGQKPQSSISGWLCNGVSFESAGAGHIWDENFNATVDGVVLLRSGNFGYNQPAYSFGGRTVSAAFRAYQISNWHITAEPSLSTSDPATPPVWFEAVYFSGNVWDHCQLAVALTSQMVNFDLSYGVSALRISHNAFIANAYNPGAAITAGELCELNSSGQAIPHTTGAIVGVALNTVSAYNGTTNRRAVMIASEGDGLTVLCPSGSNITSSDVLVPDTTEPSKVTKSVGAGKAIIGRLTLASSNGSGGSVIAFVRMNGVSV